MVEVTYSTKYNIIVTNSNYNSGEVNFSNCVITPNEDKEQDLVGLLINNSIPTEARQIGGSIFLRLPPFIARAFKIKDRDIVRILILKVETYDK